MNLLSAGLASLVVVSCSTASPPAAAVTPQAPPPSPAPKPAPPDPRQEVAPLRKEAQALLEQQTELSWRNWTTGAPMDLSEVYQAHGALFSQDALHLAAAAEAAETDPAARRALHLFRLYLEGEYLASQEALVNEQIAQIEATASVTADGRDIKYRELERQEALEPKHEPRVAMADAAGPVLDRLNPLYEQREALARQVAVELGYASYLDLAAQVREVDLTQLSQLAESVLTATEPIYLPSMRTAVKRELGMELESVRRADIPRFVRAVEVTSAFPADQMMSRLTSLLGGMGIDLASAHNITIDDKVADAKNPRAICFGVRVPSDIRVSVKPQGGVDDYKQLFHEMGHALHMANTQTPVWELQELGDNTVTEAYAFLFEDLLEEPAYLQELGMTGELLRSYVRGAAVRKLYLVRRYAAKVLFELKLHAGAADPASTYRDLMARAYGFPVSPTDAKAYFADSDELLYASDYLRAWILASQLQQALQARATSDGGAQLWWHSRDAAAFLQQLWANGNGLDAAEVSERLGATRLDPGPLVDKLRARASF